MNSNLMTPEQVDDVHNHQAREDKLFGEIAKSKGYLTEAQITELLCSQHTSHLILGQTLVDMGFMTNTQFENAINSYKRENAITDYDFSLAQKHRIDSAISRFYHFNEEEEEEVLIVSYISLLLKNCLRFIGVDFTPSASSNILYYDVKYSSAIKIEGAQNYYTYLECDSETLIHLASRYSKEEVTQNDEFSQACMSEFLNLQSGLFAVNISQNKNIELDISPPEFLENCELTFDKSALLVPVAFSFGTINLLISKEAPLIS